MLSDTTDVSLADLNVAINTPGWAPRVLDEEVVLTIFGTIANSKNTVVKSGSAGGSSDDTTGVALEGNLVGLDGDRDGLLGNGGLKGSTGFVRGDILEAGDRDGTTLLHALVARAGNTVAGGIRIGILSDHRGLLGILESIVHETTIATRVDGGALDELLLREGNEAS